MTFTEREKQYLDKVDAIRQRCIRENREPSSDERRQLSAIHDDRINNFALSYSSRAA